MLAAKARVHIPARLLTFGDSMDEQFLPVIVLGFVALILWMDHL